jgi:uncharacterized caspase-like protein
LVALFLLFVVGSTPATAEKRMALVIGNSAYQHSGALANPSNDAADMARVLKDLGFVVLERLDLDKAGMDRALREFAEAISGVDVGLFFYAGHGLQYQGQNYLVPIDAKLSTVVALDFEMVRLDLVQRQMDREGGPKANIMFLDACRDNPFGRNLARALGGRSFEVGQGLAPVESGLGTLISFSTQPGNVALDGTGRNSPFAGALVKQLAADHGEDINSILIAVRNEVVQTTRASGHPQVPWEHSALLAKFYFKSAIAFEPTDAAGFLARGKAYQDKGDYDRAITDFHKAMQLEPKNVATFRSAGEAYYEKGDYDQAITYFSRTILLEPEDALAFNGRGKAYSVKGEYQSAIADFSKVFLSPVRSPADRQRRETARERLVELAEIVKTQPSTVPGRAPTGSRVALVIGNSNYPQPAFLATPTKDARSIAEAFRRLNFSEVYEYLDLNLDAMNNALKEFGIRSQGADWAVVYYAGHSLEVDGDNYLIPIDAPLGPDGQRNYDAVPLTRVLSKVDGAKKLGLIMLDASWRNPYPKEITRKPAVAGSPIQAAAPERALASAAPEGNVLVAYASKHGTFTEVGVGEHSPFTDALLANLETPGLEINNLFRKVRADVRSKTQRHQEPFLYGSLSSELIYFKAPDAR